MEKEGRARGDRGKWEKEERDREGRHDRVGRDKE
jgi:hypothetical protein